MMHRWFREITVPLIAEEIEALLANNPDEKRDKDGKWAHSELTRQGYKKTHTGVHYKTGKPVHEYSRNKGGIIDRAYVHEGQVKKPWKTRGMGPQHRVGKFAEAAEEIAALFMGAGPHDAEPRDKSGKWVVHRPSHSVPQYRTSYHATKAEALKKAGQHAEDGWKDTEIHEPSGRKHKWRDGFGFVPVVPGHPLLKAAEEIARLMAPHDVSGENRQHGKFAPGAKQPTGSPLDPATGVKPPPAEHEVYAANAKLHRDHAKIHEGLAQDHLKMAKIALSPEDRQNHINQARQAKQQAAHHTEQAGLHAQKASASMQKAMQSPAPAGAGAGVATPQPSAGGKPYEGDAHIPTIAQPSQKGINQNLGMSVSQWSAQQNEKPGQSPASGSSTPVPRPGDQRHDHLTQLGYNKTGTSDPVGGGLATHYTHPNGAMATTHSGEQGIRHVRGPGGIMHPSGGASPSKPGIGSKIGGAIKSVGKKVGDALSKPIKKPSGPGFRSEGGAL